MTDELSNETVHDHLVCKWTSRAEDLGACTRNHQRFLRILREFLACVDWKCLVVFHKRPCEVVKGHKTYVKHLRIIVKATIRQLYKHRKYRELAGAVRRLDGYSKTINITDNYIDVFSYMARCMSKVFLGSNDETLLTAYKDIEKDEIYQIHPYEDDDADDIYNLSAPTSRGEFWNTAQLSSTPHNSPCHRPEDADDEEDGDGAMAAKRMKKDVPTPTDTYEYITSTPLAVQKWEYNAQLLTAEYLKAIRGTKHRLPVASKRPKHRESDEHIWNITCAAYNFGDMSTSEDDDCCKRKRQHRTKTQPKPYEGATEIDIPTTNENGDVTWTAPDMFTDDTLPYNSDVAREAAQTMDPYEVSTEIESPTTNENEEDAWTALFTYDTLLYNSDVD